MSDESLLPFEGIYLQSYLRPFKAWLDDPNVTEILVNRPGEVWVERSGCASMECIAAPQVSDALVERLAAQIARASHQGINRENPLLGATLPTGERIQMIAPPVTRQYWAFAIRRHVATRTTLEDFDFAPASRRPQGVPALDPEIEPYAFLRRAVLARKTILVSGGTSSGKTTLLNTLLALVPMSERIITIEDTAEIAVSHPNSLGLLAVKGALGEARVGIEDLLEASLRLRPDRIIVGEVRGREAATFLRAVNTGHPGSITTIHANSPAGALEQLALMVLQTGMPLSREETQAYCRSVIDVIVQLSRVDGRRAITAIEVTAGSASRS